MTGIRPVAVGAELFEDLGDVGGEDRSGDAIRVGDFLAGVANVGR
jgi:hypothetical protein